MNVKVHMGSLLYHITNNQYTIEVEGETVRESLMKLDRQFPKLKLFDKDGELKSYFVVSVNEEIVLPKELNKPVKDGDELSIMLVDVGG